MPCTVLSCVVVEFKEGGTSGIVRTLLRIRNAVDCLWVKPLPRRSLGGERAALPYLISIETANN